MGNQKRAIAALALPHFVYSLSDDVLGYRVGFNAWYVWRRLDVGIPAADQSKRVGRHHVVVCGRPGRWECVVMAQTFKGSVSSALYRRLVGHVGADPVAAPLSVWALSMALSLPGCVDAGAALWVTLMMVSGWCAYELSKRHADIAHAVLRFVGIACAAVIAVLAAMATGRPSLINPNWIAGIMLVAAPFVGWVSFPALLATGSRGAILSMVVAFVALVIAPKLRSRKKVLFGIILLLSLVTMAAMAVRPQTLLKRLETWQTACALWLGRPVTGHGPGASLLLLGQNHADSLAVTILLEQGALGLFALCWVGVASMQQALKRGGLSGMSILAFSIHQATDATVYMPFVAMVAGAALGCLVCRPTTAQAQDNDNYLVPPAGRLATQEKGNL